MFNVIVFLVWSAGQAGLVPASQPIELSVKGAGSRGTLVFTSDAVEFKAAEAGKARTWLYQNLKQIRIESPKKIVLETFEDRSRWRLGADRTETFEVTSGEITGETVALLLARVARPVGTSVLPANLGDPVSRLPVKHRRFGRGSQGTLAVHATGLAYVADPPTDSRFWRFADLQSVMRTSPFELLVTAYEGGSLQAYAFDLKAPMPPDVFDALWAAVNPPAQKLAR
jgi:hypothetical protein